MPKKPPTFEDKLLELEELVKKMEEGSLPLNDTLAAYEAGMRLSQSLTEELNTAEKRMQELSGGQVTPMEDAP